MNEYEKIRKALELGHMLVGLNMRPVFEAGKAALATLEERPVPLADHDNHHNALLCPYCNPNRLVLVAKEDANNYCQILLALGMEEEGDPVSEIELMRAKLAMIKASPTIMRKMKSQSFHVHSLLADKLPPDTQLIARPQP